MVFALSLIKTFVVKIVEDTITARILVKMLLKLIAITKKGRCYK
jgi:hypothetical protein